jgi:BirA family biotin operon repressor/biotin-[acetyl-CoA-carboxylase] ligase
VNRDPLDADRLRSLLGARWHSVDVVARTASTNADLLAAAAAGAPDRTLLAAEVQDAGRGRFDRVWTSPEGAGLTFSMLLRPSAPVTSWGWLPLLTGVALAQAVIEQTGVHAALKWPNDLLAAPAGGKLAGILVQSAGAAGAAGAAVVAGIGLNVSTTADELPVDTASSLTLAGAADPDRTALLAAIATAVDGWVQRLDAAGGDAQSAGLARTYADLCATLGQQVRVSLGDGGVLEGTASAIGADGALTVRTASGARPVHAGDVEHVRPA